MLRTRLLVAIVLVPVAVAIITHGGWLYILGVSLVLAGAANEYVSLLRAGGRSASLPLVIAGVLLLGLLPLFKTPAVDRIGLATFLIAATFWHLLQYERGRDGAVWDWAATVAGVVYLGVLGSVFFLVRYLPDGQWWTLTVFPAIWMSDTGAFVVGSFAAGRLPGVGRHLMAPRLSPKKTWEGFAAGILWGVLFGAIFAAIWQIGTGPASRVGFWSGALVGLVVSLAGPIGDLGISMLKREVNVKDSGQALGGGHGGLLDRIDSWLVGGAAGYLCILVILAM